MSWSCFGKRTPAPVAFPFCRRREAYHLSLLLNGIGTYDDKSLSISGIVCSMRKMATSHRRLHQCKLEQLGLGLGLKREDLLKAREGSSNRTSFRPSVAQGKYKHPASRQWAPSFYPLPLFWRMRTTKAVEIAKTVVSVRLVLLSYQFSSAFRILIW